MTDPFVFALGGIVRDGYLGGGVRERMRVPHAQGRDVVPDGDAMQVSKCEQAPPRELVVVGRCGVRRRLVSDRLSRGSVIARFDVAVEDDPCVLEGAEVVE